MSAPRWPLPPGYGAAIASGSGDTVERSSERGRGLGNNRRQGHEPVLPAIAADGLRHWQVAGGVVADERGLLLVENLRRNGEVDWSTPGGVVDPGESTVQGLTREVHEETGLSVASWTGPIYRVEVIAPDAGFFLRVEAHRAAAFTGAVTVDDPDGIVVSAEFVDIGTARNRLLGASPWVVEPLLAHLEDGVGDGRVFRYLVEGRREDRRVTRSHD